MVSLTSGESSWIIPAPLAVVDAEMADGTLIVLRRHGNPAGPRVVLSHANGLAADAYYPFWSLLTDRFDVVVFDFRNHGWNAVGALDGHTIATFVDDMTQVARAIELHFGPKPAIGVFHSLSGQTAVLEACSGAGSFAALVLFDPFICPPGCHQGHRERLKNTMGRMVDVARRRRERFETEAAFAQRLSGTPAFGLLRPGVFDLMARTTLRAVNGGAEYVLRCPREYEARIAEQGYQYAETVRVDALPCPVKVIGSDPVAPHSFLPTVAMDEIIVLNYDFVPDTTHFLQLEEPELCVDAMLDFVGKDGELVLAG
ncbi:MAG: alpha/beta hydrolase [Gammaproteobacteria bacterium]|nr:alpha/beta hydrolase [Gammaproteobacteria bacterium]